MGRAAIPLTISLAGAQEADAGLVGSKAASLIRLRRAGFRVPDADFLTRAFFAPWIETVLATAEWRRVEVIATEASPDAARLRQPSQALKRRVDDLAFSDVQRRAVEAVAAHWQTTAVAVRSSSPDEDLAGASFAGLYQTLLNVQPGDLQAAVRQCFASCMDAGVIHYKVQHRIEPVPRFALIVQRQLDPDASGVAFSLNPRNNDFDEAAINATWGLGEALVGGKIEPDHWVIDKVSGRHIECRLGTKAGDRPEVACLDESQVAAVRDSVSAVENLFGRPVDIEWAFADGMLHLLQARPITTHVPLPEELQTEPGGQRLLYFDPSLGEGLTISGAVTPLTIDLFARLFQWFGDHAFGPGFFDPDLKRSIVGAGGVRVYGNLSNLLHMADPRKVGPEKRYVDTTMAELFATVDFEPYRIEPPGNLTKPRLAWSVIVACVRLRPFFGALWRAVFRRGAFLARYRRELDAFDRAVANVDIDQPILPLAQDLYAEVGRVSLTATAPAMVMFVHGGGNALWRAIDGDSDRQRRLVMGILGGGEELILEMGLAMFRLARLLPPDAYADLPALQVGIEIRRAPARFLAQWDAFNSRFGCRGPGEMDLANPKYGDDAQLLLRQLAGLAADAGTDPAAIHASRARDREAAFAELSAVLTPRKRRRLARAYRVLRDFENVRELPKHHIAMVNMIIRRRLLSIADGWVAGGRLDRREDVFEMTLDDFQQAEKDAGLDLRAVVAERGAYYRDAKARVRHFPHLIDSRGRILRPERDHRPGELRGAAVSPGRVRGPVKVLDDPFGKPLQPGDVLVAHTADPGWTPLFINAAAVLLEIGGELQHGALLAREYGKPCVAGIAGLTSALKDDQVVEVDGDAGVVRIIGTRHGPVEASACPVGSGSARGVG